MTALESAKAKMQKNRAYPSDTEYFYGLNEDENNSLPYPMPLVADCDVTVHPNGPTTFSLKPTGKHRVLKVPGYILSNHILRKRGLDPREVNIIWAD